MKYRTARYADMGIVEMVNKYCMSFLKDLPGRAMNAQLDIIVANMDIPTAHPGRLRFPRKYRSELF